MRVVASPAKRSPDPLGLLLSLVPDLTQAMLTVLLAFEPVPLNVPLVPLPEIVCVLPSVNCSLTCVMVLVDVTCTPLLWIVVTIWAMLPFVGVMPVIVAYWGVNLSVP